ncbi:MAG: glutamate 2,3-aminomutase [Halanaerobiales bacterium]|nr:glutamate 2,3-aminomutase [Halanaerobiales bacterium]
MKKLKRGREISLQRADVLKSRIQDYLDVQESIPDGFKRKMMIERQKKKILEILGGSEEDWKNWHWQLANRINDVDILGQVLKLSNKELEEIKAVGRKYRWTISPYYLSLIDPDDPKDPIYLMSLPQEVEILDQSGELDPMAEEYTNPAGSVTRRYPDRVVLNVTNECAMYCRFCQRRRNIGQVDCHKSRAILKESIQYIRENTEIRDVLITGGDPLTLTDTMIDWLLNEITSIPHVDYVRLGTRTLITMPQRITPELCDILKKYHPLYINTHFNHPIEITHEVKEAAERLVMSGVPLGNQAVLLNGVNNDKYVMKRLNHLLLKIRVRPYYIFHPKHVRGTSHFLCSIDEGIEIMEHLRGYTSGMAIPSYIVNAPGGKGKTPILPNYIISREKDYVTLRTWEGEIIQYPNIPNIKTISKTHLVPIG